MKAKKNLVAKRRQTSEQLPITFKRAALALAVTGALVQLAFPVVASDININTVVPPNSANVTTLNISASDLVNGTGGIANAEAQVVGGSILNTSLGAVSPTTSNQGVFISATGQATHSDFPTSGLTAIAVLNADSLISGASIVNIGSITISGTAASNGISILGGANSTDSQLVGRSGSPLINIVNSSSSTGAFGVVSVVEISRTAAVTTQSDSNILNNAVTNAGAIDVSGNATNSGILIGSNVDAVSGTAASPVFSVTTTRADADASYGNFGADATATATSEATSTAVANAESSISGNTVSNSGSIIAGSSATAIRITTDVFAEAATSATASATADAVAVGDLDGSNNDFVQSVDNANATADANSTASADARVVNNSITNAISGELTGEVGIRIDGTSYAAASSIAVSVVAHEGVINDFSGSGGNFDNGIATSIADSTATATTILLGNTVNNAGRITATTRGIELFASADADDSATGSENGVTGDAALVSASSATANIRTSEITNSGTVVVSDGNGIRLYALAGSSTTPPDTATAVVDSNTIVNTGLIVANQVGGVPYDGIRLEAEAFGATSASATVSNNIITNSGFLYARDDGIQLDASAGSTGIVQGNEITNSYPGRIVSSSNAIELDSPTVRNNTITNSGLLVTDRDMTISGTSVVKGARFALNNRPESGNIRGVIKIQSDVTDLRGDDPDLVFNTVNLNAPSYIAGHFEFNRFADVRVNLTSGVSHSVRWVFRDVNNGTNHEDALGASRFSVAGPVPWFTNMTNLTAADAGGNGIQGGTDDVFATIDPSAFAAAPNQLSDLSGMASGFAVEGLGRRGAQRNGFWVAANGARMDYKGDERATMDQKTRLEGAAFGYNRDFNSVRVGVMLGEAKSKLRVGSFYSDIYNHSFDNKASGAFAGVHLQGALGPVQVGLGLTTGKMKHEDRRFINDNLQWWGESYATSTYTSRWYAPELTLSVPVSLTDTVTLTPSLHARHSVQKVDRYTETGSNANATVHAHTVKMGETRVGLDLTKKYAGNSTVGVQLGYVQRDLNGQDFVRVTMIGDTKNVPMFTRNMGAGYVGFNWNLALTDAVSFQLKGTHMSGSEGKGGNVSAKLNVEF
jgi:hypothetical protein